MKKTDVAQKAMQALMKYEGTTLDKETVAGVVLVVLNSVENNIEINWDKSTKLADSYLYKDSETYKRIYKEIKEN